MQKVKNTNKNKVILDLCGGTGSWSKPYKDAGYQVIVVTLPHHDIRHAVLNPRGICFPSRTADSIVVQKQDVYGILAAPPCTMFSRARTTAKTPRDFVGAMQIVSACLEIVWACRSAGSLRWWALENPMGFLRQFLGNPAHSFRGWEFGDDHVKFTDIWGYHTMPVGRFKKPISFDRTKWAGSKKPKEYANIPMSRADVRAITPPGFAKAFFKVNP